MTNSSGRRIALFGGAFDPPHLGHAVVIQSILDSGLVDELWLLPSGVQRYDKNSQANAVQRQKMCEIFLEECFPHSQQVRIETADLKEEIPDSSTLKALELMQQRYPNDSFFIIIGSDNIKNLSSWKFSDRLLREAKFIAVTRADLAFQGDLPSNVKLITPKQSSAASSTKVREALKQQQSIIGLLSERVHKYILDSQLYS